MYKINVAYMMKSHHSFGLMLDWLCKHIGPIQREDRPEHMFIIHGTGWRYEYLEYRRLVENLSPQERKVFENDGFEFESYRQDKAIRIISRSVFIDDEHQAIEFKLSL